MAARTRAIAIAAAAFLLALAASGPVAAAQTPAALVAEAAPPVQAPAQAAERALSSVRPAPPQVAVKAPSTRPAVKAPSTRPAVEAVVGAAKPANAPAPLQAAGAAAAGSAGQLDLATAPARTAVEQAASPARGSAEPARARIASSSGARTAVATPSAERSGAFSRLATPLLASADDTSPAPSAAALSELPSFPKESIARGAQQLLPASLPNPQGQGGPSLLQSTSGAGSSSLFFGFAALLLAALAITPHGWVRRLRIDGFGFPRLAYTSLTERPG